MSDFQDDEEDSAPDATPDFVGPPAPAPFVGPPAPAANPAAAPSQQPWNPDTKAYIQQLLQQKSQGQAGLAAAQKKASENQLITDLGRSFSTLAQSVPGHTKPINTAAFDAMDKTNQAPVTNFEAQQEEAKLDPTSPQSKAAQAAVKRLYPGKYSDEDLSQLSAKDIPDIIYKPSEIDQKVQERRAESADRQADRTTAREDKTDAANERAETKRTADQEKAYTAMRKDLESFRGNQSVQQAAQAVQNADKALALVKSAPTAQNLALLADEMGKVAMGGVPGEHGVQALAPNTLYTKLAEIKSFLSGKPSEADVAGFLKNNEDYLNTVKDISNKTLHGYRTNIAKGYKNRVAADDYAAAVADYGLGGDRQPEGALSAPKPVERTTSDGKTALFDPNTKKFLGYKP